MQTVEANGTVEIRGVPCKPGDLICADEAGVAIIPQDKIAAVLEISQKIDGADSKRKVDIDKGVCANDLITKNINKSNSYKQYSLTNCARLTLPVIPASTGMTKRWLHF